jgi:hypothetical protein
MLMLRTGVDDMNNNSTRPEGKSPAQREQERDNRRKPNGNIMPEDGDKKTMGPNRPAE